MRQANYDFLDGKPGLSHPAKQSRDVHAKYRDSDCEQLRSLARRVLNG